MARFKHCVYVCALACFACRLVDRVDLVTRARGLRTLPYYTPPQVSEVNDFLRLWVHECRRVFQDRLVNDTDRQWFDSKVCACSGWACALVTSSHAARVVWVFQCT